MKYKSKSDAYDGNFRNYELNANPNHALHNEQKQRDNNWKRCNVLVAEEASAIQKYRNNMYGLIEQMAGAMNKMHIDNLRIKNTKNPRSVIYPSSQEDRKPNMLLLNNPK